MDNRIDSPEINYYVYGSSNNFSQEFRGYSVKKRQSFQQMALRKLDRQVSKIKMKLSFYLTP